MPETTKLDRKNMWFYIIFGFLVVASITVTFCKIVVLKDYQMMAETSCNPATEKCFVRTCDPTTDDTCPTDTAAQTTYYKNISKSAATIYKCEQTVEKLGCDADLSCTPNEPDCSYTYCTATNVPDGEACSD